VNTLAATVETVWVTCLHVGLAEVRNRRVSLAVINISTEVDTITEVAIIALALPSTINIDALRLIKAIVHAVNL
jgi:ABC-type proline/glycine betaine transport system permease subunit